MRNAIAFFALLGLTSISGAGAQTLPRPVWTGVSSRAAQQLDDVTKAMAVYATPERASKDGFVSILGWIPTMGTHWVNNVRMFKEGKKIDLESPVQLMYSPVDGKQTLVGAAYSYLTPLNDTTHPLLSTETRCGTSIPTLHRPECASSCCTCGSFHHRMVHSQGTIPTCRTGRWV
jgi:hypothetical protein